MHLCLVAVVDEFFLVSERLLAELTLDLLLVPTSPHRPLALLLRFLDPELVLELESLRVTRSPEFRVPILVVLLWEHEPQIRNISEVEPLVLHNSKNVVVSALSKRKPLRLGRRTLVLISFPFLKYF